MPLNPLPPYRDPVLASIRRNNRDASYGAAFLQANRHDHGPCSAVFGDVLWALFQPESLIEFGCASGYTLWSLLRHGTDVLGLDVSEDAHRFAREVGGDELAGAIVAPLDLNEPIPDGMLRRDRYEVALSIEVLEHLRPESADLIVRAICEAAPIAAITACPPVGRNPLHLNEQPFPYWIEKFEANGHALDERTTNAVKTFMRSIQGQGNIIVPSWYFSSYFGVFREQ